MKLHKKKSLKKFGLWLIAAFVAVVVGRTPAHASTDTVHIDIHVSISASKSLAINTTSYNFGALAVNTSSVSASAITVTNDSGALLETYTMQGANATSSGGGTTWNIAASTGVIDQYVLAFQSSSQLPLMPANADSTLRNSDSLTPARSPPPTPCSETARTQKRRTPSRL